MVDKNSVTEGVNVTAALMDSLSDEPEVIVDEPDDAPVAHSDTDGE